MKIDFMVAGVQKGGTTAMYHNLCSHPEIGMARRKEVHFFDRKSCDWNAPVYDELHSLYRPGHAVYGESTPITSFWTEAHERIRAYNPNMWFILLFRDPVERAYSQWCMEYARGRDRLPFDQAIRDGRARTKYKPRPYSYVERGFYANQIDCLMRVFPGARMLYLTSDELLSRRNVALAKVANFLGVDPCRFGIEPIVAHTRESVAYPSVITQADRDYLQDLYASDLERFASITGLDIESWPSISRLSGSSSFSPRYND